jgi:hypothetical protein
MSTVDKIELPLDLARALYKVYASWDTVVSVVDGDIKGYGLITWEDDRKMTDAASTVDDLLTVELVAILGGPDVSS